MKRCLRVLWLTFSEVDEKYIDLFRVGYALVLVSGICLSTWAVANGQEFDVTAFGTGLGAILFGGGVGTGLRARLEDGNPNKPTYEQGGSPEWRVNSPWNKNAPQDIPGSDDGSHWFANEINIHNDADDDNPPSRYTE